MLSKLAARMIPALGRQHRRLNEQSDALAALRQRVRDLLGRAKEQDRLLSLATEGSTELQEYARHLGHADLLRESIDGRTGQ